MPTGESASRPLTAATVRSSLLPREVVGTASGVPQSTTGTQQAGSPFISSLLQAGSEGTVALKTSRPWFWEPAKIRDGR